MGHFPTITPEQLDLSQDTFDFTQTLSDTLGNLGTPDDGFDALVAETVLELSGAVSAGSAFDDDLGQASGIAGTIDPNSLLADATSLPTSLATGDAILADANSLNASVTPAPAPPSGGGGGGPSPAPAPAPKNDYNFTAPDSRAFNAKAMRVLFHNNTQKNIGVSVDGLDSGGGIGYLNVTDATLLPNATRELFDVWVVGSATGDYTGSVTLHTDGPRATIRVGFSGHTTVAGQGPGAGGGVATSVTIPAV